MTDMTGGRAAEPTLADGAATIMQMQRTQWRLAALRALVTIGCPEQLEEGPLSIPELAARCDAHAPTLRRLLRTVAQTGLVRSVPPDGYALTGAGHALVTGPGAMSLKFGADAEVWGTLGDLPEIARTGKAPFASRYGSIYDYLSARPAISAVFDQFMEDRGKALTTRLAEVGSFSEGEVVVDVGGGIGTWLAAILRAHPGTRGVLVDMERTMARAREFIDAQGVADRTEFAPGDFFTAVPAGGDAYLLLHVLHNWDDELATRILRVVRAAIPAHGRLLVVESVLPDDDSPHFAKDVDMRMLSLHSGVERSLAEYDALLAATGFGRRQMTDLDRAQVVIIATPTAQ